MTFSIVIPCYREHDSLLRNVPILAQKYHDEGVIILVENGSNIAPDFSYLNVEKLTIPKKGLGIALKAGLTQARTECVVFLPADLSYGLAFVELGRAIIEDTRRWDMVIGSKLLPNSKVKRPLVRELVSKFYNTYWNVRFELGVSDITGVKAYRRSAMLKLLEECQSTGIYFEVELIRAMRRHGMEIIEVPVTVRDFRPSRFVPWQEA